MRLWTIQKENAYKQVLEDGSYSCDSRLSVMGRDYKECYDWMASQMKKRVGPPPDGIEYPIWAWYKWEGKHHKPDLRMERWNNGYKGDIFACIELEVPEKSILLSDFDAWSIILLNGFVSDTEKEQKELTALYEVSQDKKHFKQCNWERAFDISPFENDWTLRGDSIQATFWEIKREYIVDVSLFESAVNVSS